MNVLVCYDVASDDVAGRRRLRKISEACKNHGVRVQYSVFECEVSETVWVKLRHRFLSIMDVEKDSLRFYFLDQVSIQHTEHHGVRAPLDLSGPLIV